MWGSAFAYVVGAISEEDLAAADGVEHVSRTSSVVGLPLAQLKRDRVAVGIDDGMDLGRQPASRTPHACGWSEVPSGGSLRIPLLPLAAC